MNDPEPTINPARAWLENEQRLVWAATGIWRNLDGKQLSPKVDRLRRTIENQLWGPLEQAPSLDGDPDEYWERRIRVEREWQEDMRTARPIMQAWAMLVRQFPANQRKAILRRIYYDFTLSLQTVLGTMSRVFALLTKAMLVFFVRLELFLSFLKIKHAALEREIEDRGPPGLLVTSTDLSRRGPPLTYVISSRPQPEYPLAHEMGSVMT